MSRERLYSLDVIPPGKPPFNLKKTIKKILLILGVYKSPHGKDVSKTFFASLYLDPSFIKMVELELVSSQKIDGITELYVNGKVVEAQFENNIGKISTEFFYAYENLLSLKKELDVERINLLPLVGKGELDKNSILTQQYRLGDTLSNKQNEHSFRIVPKVQSEDPVINCILQAKITDSNNPFCGLYYPAFDVNAKSYRLCSWTWTNGVLVKVFLDTAMRNEDGALREAGLSLADRLLDFQEGSGEERGAIMARWDILNQSPSGIAPLLATNDSAFLASNAFLSAFTVSKDKKYLKAALLVGEWILNRGMKSGGQLYIGKRLDTGQWVKNHIFVDAGFTSSLFAGLYKVTAEAKWKEAAVRFEDWYIQHLYDEKNQYFWWNWYDFRRPGTAMFARGQAWAMDGLIATYNITHDKKYLMILNQLASTLMRTQAKTGAWYYHLDKPSTGYDAKGTPIIAYHLARIWKITKNEQLGICIEKAMNWCKSAIDVNENDVRTFGGIAASSEEGTMYGARNVITIFMYAQAYYKLCQQVLKGADYEY